MSPVKIQKTQKADGYRVSHGKKVSAKSTTKTKAKGQANLLRAVSHSNWRPTGKRVKGRRMRKSWSDNLA